MSGSGIRLAMLAALLGGGPNTGAAAARGPRRPGKIKTNPPKRGRNTAQEEARRRRQIEAGVLRAESRAVGHA